jgi:hypothetical protein
METLYLMAKEIQSMESFGQNGERWWMDSWDQTNTVIILDSIMLCLVLAVKGVAFLPMLSKILLFLEMLSPPKPSLQGKQGKEEKEGRKEEDY